MENVIKFKGHNFVHVKDSFDNGSWKCEQCGFWNVFIPAIVKSANETLHAKFLSCDERIIKSLIE